MVKVMEQESPQHLRFYLHQQKDESTGILHFRDAAEKHNSPAILHEFSGGKNLCLLLPLISSFALLSNVPHRFIITCPLTLKAFSLPSSLIVTVTYPVSVVEMLEFKVPSFMMSGSSVLVIKSSKLSSRN